MKKTIDNSVIVEANDAVNKLFANNGLVFTEYRYRQGLLNVDSSDEDYAMKDMMLLLSTHLLHPREKTDLNQIYGSAYETDKRLPAEICTPGMLRPLGSVSVSRPFENTGIVALSGINLYSGAYPKVTDAQYIKILSLCDFASNTYSAAFGKEWPIKITVK